MSAERPELDPFTVESFVAEGARRTGGLEDFGDGPFVEPLGLFLDSLENEARLNETGRLIARERALLHIVNRLNYVNDRKLYPEIAEQKIVRPVFIIGFPRTGTTILHDILAQDPDSRAPLTWEVTFPSPPPEASTFHTDPRIALTASMLPTPETETERDRQFKAMHPMGAELSQECVVMMGEAMCTPLFHNQFRVPSYQDWVDARGRLVARLRLPSPAVAAPAMAGAAARPVGAEDRRASVGSGASAAHLSGRQDRLHPSRSGEVGDLVREPHVAGALERKRRRRPLRGRPRLDPAARPRHRPCARGPSRPGVPRRDLLRHALPGLRRRPVRRSSATSTKPSGSP